MRAAVLSRRPPTYAQLLELAIVIVGELHSLMPAEDRPKAVRPQCEAVEVACLVMDWQIALGEDGSGFAFETAILLEVAVELVVKRGMWASDALYAELALMPASGLTAWDGELDAWFAVYGRARCGRFEPLVKWLTACEQAFSNHMLVIVTPLDLSTTMIEQMFCTVASEQLTACGRARADAVRTFGVQAYIAAGRLIAAMGVATSDGLAEGDVSDVDRRELDDVFEQFALSLGDIDRPPLPCLILAEQYRTWFLDVLVPEFWRHGFASVAQAAYDGAVDWLAQLRDGGGCCSSGCAP